MNRNSLPSFYELSTLFNSEQASFNFLISNGVVLSNIRCRCGQNVLLNTMRKSYRCSARGCRKELSVFKETFFYKCKLPINEILHLGYMWLCGMTSDCAIKYSGHSSTTITAYYDYFRKLVSDSLDEEDFQIGGPGIIVEIDESKFGKRKYHRGHFVEGAWIFGGVERTEDRKVFLVQVNDRSQETLLSKIYTYILPGSIIYSDLWRGYIGIEEILNMSHYTVNHSLGFVNNESGVHTNTIEGTWSGIKRKIAVRNRNRSCIDEHLLEFVWRRKCNNFLWESFLNALKDVSFNN